MKVATESIRLVGYGEMFFVRVGLIVLVLYQLYYVCLNYLLLFHVFRLLHYNIKLLLFVCKLVD